MKYEPQSTLNRRVLQKAPTNPSTVFFGESLIKGVRPTVIPHTYANISLQITNEAGTQNQIMPSRILLTMK
jgi:hypothetical protein